MIRTDRKALLGALRRCLKAISTRPGIPCLAGVLVTPGRDALELVCTDLETTVRATVPALCAPADAFLVPAKMLADALKSASSPDVWLSPSAKDVVVESTGIATLRLLPAEDFPAIAGTGPACARIDGPDFVRISESERFASRDEARPTLTGVSLEIGPKGLTATATDSYRLGMFEAPGCYVAAGTDVASIIPAHALKVAAGFLGKRSTDTVRVSVGEHTVTFASETDAWSLEVRMIEGQFPNWRQLLPDLAGGDWGMLAVTDALRDATAAAGAFLGRGANQPMRLELSGRVSVKAQSPDLGQFCTDVDAAWTGEDVITAYNPSYLGDALAGAEILYVRDGLRPAMAVSPGRRALVMPVRLPAPIA